MQDVAHTAATFDDQIMASASLEICENINWWQIHEDLQGIKHAPHAKVQVDPLLSEPHSVLPTATPSMGAELLQGAR